MYLGKRLFLNGWAGLIAARTHTFYAFQSPPNASKPRTALPTGTTMATPEPATNASWPLVADLTPLLWLIGAPAAVDAAGNRRGAGVVCVALSPDVADASPHATSPYVSRSSRPTSSTSCFATTSVPPSPACWK